MKGPLGIPLNPSEAQKAFEPVLQVVFTLNDLTHKGDHDAAVELFRLAALATENLTAWCQVKPEMFSPIAADQIAWPAMHTLHRGLVRKNDELLKRLKLASSTNINISDKGKAFSFDTPAVQVALHHYKLARVLRRAPISEWNTDEWIIACSICDCTPDRFHAWQRWGQSVSGKSLPPLSRDTAAQWKKVFPEFFRLIHGGDFDQCVKLENLRDSVLQRAKDGSDEVGGRGIVRKLMLQAVRQAIDSIAAGQ
jgi:hypothetical protein